MEWGWNEVDGVTTLSAPPGATQGPLQACLVFGVGRTDETMPVAGITSAGFGGRIGCGATYSVAERRIDRSSVPYPRESLAPRQATLGLRPSARR